MSIPIEDAIKLIRIHMELDHIGQYPHVKLGKALTMAIDALQEKAEREDPKPLTIEELRQMDGCPVYVVPLEPDKKEWEEWCVMDGEDAYVPGIEYWAWHINKYDVTWIAYRHKPKEDA